MKEVEIHPYGSSPLRSQRDYGESMKTANINIAYFSEKANQIIEKLQDFQYGCCYVNGEIIVNLDDIHKKDGAQIYIQSPLEFWNHKIGMCHDASVLIDAIFTIENIEHLCYYIYSDEPPFYPTHSFVVAKCNDGYYRIIDVFATSSCLYDNKFDNADDAALWRMKLWIKLDNNNKNNAHLFISEHMPYPKCDFLKFSNKVMKSFKECSVPHIGR